MKNTKNAHKNSLWVELTAEETSLVKGGSWGYNKGGGSGGGKGGGSNDGSVSS